MECLSMLVVSACALVGPTDHGDWSYTVTSSGSSESWSAPVPLRTDGGHYEMRYTITGATVMVSYIGIDFGPIDVMDMIPTDVIETFRTQPGPCPLQYDWIEVVTPAGQDPPSLAYDWLVEIDAKGIATYHMDNLFLGESDYNLGWPWGIVTVQIESGTVTANLKIDIVENACYEDIDGSGTVDVVDLLALIGNWGDCSGCDNFPPGDVNYDMVVDVSDILLVVGSWGDCPE
jgi:PKD repeat protein